MNIVFGSLARTCRGAGAIACLAAGALTAMGAPPARAADEAIIRLEGMIPVKCEIGIGAEGRENATLDFEVYRDHEIEEVLKLDCNLPVAMSLKATEGALVYQTENGDGVVNRSEIDYALSVAFPGMGRAGPFRGPDLVSGVSFDSGEEVLYDEEGTLEISFEPVVGLPAGAYTERLSITVRPIE